MLYEIHELQHATLAPWNAVALTSLQFLTHPFSPLSYLPASRKLAAGAEVFFRLTQRYEKPEFGLLETVVDGHTVPVVEQVPLEKPFCRLLHFRRAFPA